MYIKLLQICFSALKWMNEIEDYPNNKNCSLKKCFAF